MRSDVSYSYRLIAAFVLPAACAWFVATVVRKCSPGWRRLVVCMPIFAFNFCSPALFDGKTQLISKCIVNLCFVWLSNFKVFALCLDRGPLSRKALSPVQFYALYVAPVTPQDELKDIGDEGIPRTKSAGTLGDHGGSAGDLCFRFVTKTFVLFGCVTILSEFANRIPRLVLEYTYAVALYTFLGFAMDGPASVLTSVIGLQIAPHFNKPFIAESLKAFWGQRWNLTISNCMRGPIYDPIYEGHWIKGSKPKVSGSVMRRFVGMSACFVVSGLMHELVYWYMMGTHTHQWKWLTFFTVQSPLLALEAFGKKLMKRYSLHLPHVVKILATMVVLMWLADRFFFPPCLETDLADRVVAAVNDNFKQLCMPLFPQAPNNYSLQRHV